MLNRTLQEQVTNHLGDTASLPADMQKLLQAISDSYDKYENEHRQMHSAERKSLRRERHLEASQRIAHTGSWELDLTAVGNILGNDLYWSDETYRIFGLEPGEKEVTYEFFLSYVHPDDVPKVKAAVDKAMDTNGIYDVDHRLLLSDGTEKIVRERGELIRDPVSSMYVKMIGTVQDITERIRSRKELEKLNNEMNILFENIREVFFSVDMVSYKLLQMSQACEEIYGYSLDEFRGNANLWYDVILEEDKHIIQRNDEKMRAGHSIDQEYRIRHKNGEIRWLQTKIKSTMDEDGILLRIDGISSDVTKRKEAELALKDSEYLFRSLIEHSADAIMLVNKRAEINYVSDSLCRIMGYEREELLGANTFDYIYEEDKKRLQEHMLTVLGNPHNPMTVIYRRVKKDGTIIWCEGVAVNMLHDSKVNGIVVNFRDITERITTEEALANSERKFRSLIRNSSDVITVTDEKLNIVFCSDSIYKMTGFTPRELYGLKSMQFAAEDDADVVSEFLKDVLASPGVAKTIVYRTLKKDGSYIWCERSTTNLLHDSSIKGIVSNFRDITERYNYEHALEESNASLKKTNEELDKFVYSVSHDLRAPLSSMLGVVEYAETETEDTQMLEHLDMLKTSIWRLDGFIADILDYSRNARAGIDKDEVDMEDLVEEVVSGLKHMVSENNTLSIQVSIGDDRVIHSDKSRIMIVLNNLVSNAIRYSDRNKEESVVQILSKKEKHGLSVTVRDNGIGISPDKQDKVFDMFYRVSKKSPGSGIGLYLVKETVEKLKGEIQLHSEPGKGSAFTVYLPDLADAS